MEVKVKKAQILEAAIRRFAHFGVQKTTLTEIADDLGMTKQALAYYYADKHKLSEAVEEQMLEEFFGSVEAHFAAAASSGEALMELVEIKRKFFEKYAMLMQTVGAEVVGQVNRIAASRQKAHSRMEQLIVAQLQQGMDRGELKPHNPREMALLLLDTISAFDNCAMGRQMVPDPKTFDVVCDRQKAVIRLMVAGLKEEAWKN